MLFYRSQLRVCMVTLNIVQPRHGSVKLTVYLGLRLPWLRGRSCTRNVCLFLLFLVL
jgi:hypothetical protein